MGLWDCAQISARCARGTWLAVAKHRVGSACGAGRGVELQEWPTAVMFVPLQIAWTSPA